jgi:hypothetical protein
VRIHRFLRVVVPLMMGRATLGRKASGDVRGVFQNHLFHCQTTSLSLSRQIMERQILFRMCHSGSRRARNAWIPELYAGSGTCSEA